MTASWRDLDFGVTCIDAGYVEPGIACFYLLGRDDEYAVIETGTSHSIAALEQCLGEKGISDQQLRYVIPTHVHLDHAGGAGTIMARFPSAQLLVHPRGARHLIDPGRLVESSIQVYGEQAFHRMYGEITPVPVERVQKMADGDSVTLGNSVLEFRHTRGHADHHFCVWDALSQGWFSGDMFGISYSFLRFTGGNFVLPATTPTQFNPALFAQSVELLAQYQPKRMYLTHYGELPYDSKVKQLLLEQVASYQALASQYAQDHEALKSAVLDCTLDALRPLLSDDDANAYRDRLNMDADLNAQGLTIWWQKHVAALSQESAQKAKVQ
ncbi:MAG: MBL fold metallo-hydrolase [Halieaceae bacterium]